MHHHREYRPNKDRDCCLFPGRIKGLDFFWKESNLRGAASSDG